MTSLWGPVARPGGGTRFRLWAPDSDAVLLEVEGRAPVPMAAQEQGWFTLDAPVGEGAHYRFRVAPGLVVPDPASHAQSDGVHGASVLTDLAAFPWRREDWRGRPWHEAVIYEVHAGTMGGFDGVRAALPRLKALGVTAIELMPVAEAPGVARQMLLETPTNEIGTLPACVRGV